MRLSCATIARLMPGPASWNRPLVRSPFDLKSLRRLCALSRRLGITGVTVTAYSTLFLRPAWAPFARPGITYGQILRPPRSLVGVIVGSGLTMAPGLGRTDRQTSTNQPL